MAKSITQLVDEVIAREGGYVDHPADRGGPTNWGVTQAVARANGWKGSMRDFPRAQAAQIYRKLYWEQPKFDVVAAQMPTLAEELFDTGINAGTGTAVGFLQRSLNALNRNGADFPDLAIDRQIGPATVRAVTAFKKARGKAAEGVLLKAVEALQGAHYLRLAESRPSQEAFVFGWLAHRIGNTKGE